MMTAPLVEAILVVEGRQMTGKSYDEMVQDSLKKNLGRAVSALKKLESCQDGKCIGCGRKVYRDSAVLIRPGFWIAPASFHERDCPIAAVMSEMQKEVIIEEEARDKQWHKEYWAKPENKALLERNKILLKELEIKIEESETSKFN